MLTFPTQGVKTYLYGRTWGRPLHPEAVAVIPSVIGPVSHGDATEAELPEDDSVKLNARIDAIFGHASSDQPGLPSAQQLFALQVRQSTSFLA